VRLIEKLRAEQALPTPERRVAIRENAGVSKRAVALELGVSAMTVGRWEAGDRAPRGEMAARYGELLVELDELSANPTAEAS
jgi:DNA-binding transcriptional regulator YiaG